MKKLVAFVLSVLMMLSFVSCKNENGKEDSQSSDVSDETTYAGDHFSDEPLNIVKDSVSDYKIVRIGNQLSIVDMANSVQKSIKEKTGCELSIVKERDTDLSAKEIVIGISTVNGNGNDGIDRTGLNDDGYIMKADRNRVLLTASTVAGVQRSVNHFIYKYVKAGDISVPGDLNHIVKNEPEIEKLTIEGHDVSEYVVVCDMAASASVNHAATELVHYIDDACGVHLEIVPSANGKYSIRLDGTEYKDDESFSIKTDENGIVIKGSPVRGLLYGVYHFLEEYLGWNFLPYDTDVLMTDKNVSIENIDYEYTPYFEFRAPYWTPFSVNRYATKRMVNSNVGRYDDPSLGSYYGFTGNYVHTFKDLLGTSANTQPCLSDEATYTKLLDSVMKILEENPDADIISVSQNDNTSFCKCEGCTGKKIGGNTTDALLLLVNRVAEAVEKEYPNVKIHTLAYTVTRIPPKVVKPRDNVIVQLCDIECCFNHALNDDSCERNASFKNDLEAWSEICDNLYVWDYTTNYRFYLAPFPNFDVLASNIRLFYEHNVIGVFAQGNEFNLWGEFGELRSYLIAELINDPYMTEDEYDSLINKFLKGYYGEGWQNIRDYLDFLMETSNKMDHFGIYATPDGMYVADDFINRKDDIEAWFNAAEDAASNVSMLRHIQTLRLSSSYLIWYFNYDVVFEEGTREDIEAMRKTCSELFKAIAAEGIRLMDVRAPLGDYANAVDKAGSPRKWDPLANTVNIPDNGFTD